MNKEILLKIDEIIDCIKNSEDYQKYLLLKDQMEHNMEIVELIEEVKLLQKEIAHGHNDKESILSKKMEELNSIPLYREYNNTLFVINNTLSIVEKEINDYFYKKLN